MRLKLGLALTGLMLFLSAGAPLWAQDPPPPPRYSLVYSVSEAGVRVASLGQDGAWQAETLPALLPFGVMGETLVMPRWSPDGLGLYTSVYDIFVPDLALEVQRYDLLRAAFTPVVTALDPLSLRGALERVALESISPDGRYAWARGVVGGGAFLLNLEVGTSLALTELCPARPLAWAAQTLYVACTGAGFAAPDVLALDLATGQTRLLLPPSSLPALANRAVTAGRLLSDGRLLIGEPSALATTLPAPIGLLETDAYGGAYFGLGQAVQVNPNETALAFWEGGRWKRVNLLTGALTDLGAGELWAGQLWEGETLRFWRTHTSPNGNFEIFRIESAPLRRAERKVYSGARPARLSFAPQGEAFALEFASGVGLTYIELYRAGELVWVSDAVYPGSSSRLQGPLDAPLQWTRDGAWLHLVHVERSGAYARGLAVNVADPRRVVLAPEDRAQYMGESPDGVWWLYSLNLDPDSERKTRLFVYDFERVAAFELWSSGDIGLYNNFQYPEWVYYQWSPLVTSSD